MQQVKVLSVKNGSELEQAVNRAVQKIDTGLTGVTKVETFPEGDGITAVIHYDTEYYTI